jgi:hypothetical protein
MVHPVSQQQSLCTLCKPICHTSTTAVSNHCNYRSNQTTQARCPALATTKEKTMEDDLTKEAQEISRLWLMWLGDKTVPGDANLLSWAFRFSLDVITYAIQRTSRKQLNVGAMDAAALHRYCAGVAINRTKELTTPRTATDEYQVPAEWLQS